MNREFILNWLIRVFFNVSFVEKKKIDVQIEAQIKLAADHPSIVINRDKNAIY